MSAKKINLDLHYQAGRMVLNGEDNAGNFVSAEISMDQCLADLVCDTVKTAALLDNDTVPAAIEYDTLTDRNVPVILCYPKGAKNLPLVFLNHGTNGNAAHLLGMGMKLAQDNFFCVMVDAQLHGRRKPENFADVFFKPKNYKRMYLNLLLETCADISALIDYFTGDSRVDATRVGITGISQGGYVSFMSITKDKRIKAAAPMIGSPDLEDKYGYSPDFDMLTEEVKQAVILHSPLRNFEKMHPAALLVQSGVKDTVVPVGGTRRLDEKLRPFYKGKGIEDRYQFIEYPELAHEAPEEMRRRAMEWLKTHLSLSK